ncbi:hypothetical protein ACFX2I_010823 [Malus domestica]
MSEPEAAEEGSRRRLILHEFLSLQECKELAHPFGLATDPMFSRPLSRTSSPPKLIRTYLSGCSSSNMYSFSPDQTSSDHQLGFDICQARLHVLGYDLLFRQDKSHCYNIAELTMEPLRLARGDELFDHEFHQHTACTSGIHTNADCHFLLV